MERGMSTKWFRMYHELLDDPKVQSLPAEDFKGWVNILCLAARNEGRIPDVKHVAFALRMSEIDAGSLVDRLSIAGLIARAKGGANGCHIAPHNWDKRQYKSDTSTPRVKRYRERRGNVAETPPDTDTDTEKKEENNTPPLEQTSHVQAHAREAPARGGAGLDLRKEILSAFQYAGCPHIPDTARAEVWLAQGYSPELILATIRDVLVRKPDVTSLAYFDPALRRAKDSAPKAALPESSEDVERRDRQRIELWLRNDNWPGAWGDPPGHPRCTLPRHLIDDALRRRAEGLRGAA